MIAGNWILDENGNPVREKDLMTWARWFEKSTNRVVKQETIGDVRVSTVFLGIDHNFELHGPPILWETMIFGGPLDREQSRCAGNREQAEAMHEKMVQRIKRQALSGEIE